MKQIVALAMALAACSATTASAQAPTIVRVVPLLAPYYRPGEAYPLAVYVAAGATGWSGAVELTWGGARLEERVAIGAGATRAVWFYPQAGAHGEVGSFVATITLASGTADVIATHTAALSGRRVYAVDQLIGVIGPRSDQLEYFSRLPGERTRSAVEVRDLPDRAQGLAVFDLLVLGAETRPLPIESPAARALRGYVALGGAVLVADLEVARHPQLAFLFPGGRPPRWPEGPAIARSAVPRPGELFGLEGSSALVYLIGAHGHPPSQLGRGRGILLADDGVLSAGNLRWEGTPRLWAFLDLYAASVRRRPAPWTGEAAELSGLIRPVGDPGRAAPELPRRLYAAILAVAGGALLLASRASRTARVAAPAFALVAGAGGAFVCLATIPAGVVSVRCLARVEVGEDQTSGDVAAIAALDARRDASVAIDIDSSVDALRAIGESALPISTNDRAWTLDLGLRRGEYRLIGARWTASVGPCSVAGAGDDAVWLNGGSHRLVGPTIVEDGRFHRLATDAIEGGGAASLAGRREVPQVEVARALFPDLAEPDRAFDWLFTRRTVAGTRLALARIDLPLPALAGPELLPPRPAPALVVLALPPR